MNPHPKRAIVKRARWEATSVIGESVTVFFEAFKRTQVRYSRK